MAVADLPKLKGVRFTPTQQRIMDLLSDGELHSKQEIFKCLSDDLSQPGAIHCQITLIRNKIRAEGYAIMIQFRDRVPQYALVKTLKEPA